MSDQDEQLRLAAPILEDGYKVQREDNRRFQAIEPPAADRDVIEKLWTAYDEQTALVGRLGDAARERDAGRFLSLIEEQERVTTRASGLAQGYGFKECGSGKNRADRAERLSRNPSQGLAAAE